MTTLRINITREVLEKTKDCKDNHKTNCVIAYAVREIWPNATVGLVWIKQNDGEPARYIRHHQTQFIQIFDTATPAQRAAMTPFSFDIEVPDEVINEINIDEVRRIVEGSKTLELV